QTVDLAWLGRADPDLPDLVGGLGRHHLDARTRTPTALGGADIGAHTGVGVAHRVEDPRPGGVLAVRDQPRATGEAPRQNTTAARSPMPLPRCPGRRAPAGAHPRTRPESAPPRR